MSLDKNSQEPLYVQLMRQIKDMIQNGHYKPGDQIPTEAELGEIFKVSRITVRRTIEELCAQGFLAKKQGKGTFVAEPKIYRKIELENNMSFSEACRSNGSKPSSHIVACHFMQAEAWQSEFLKLSDNKNIYHIERVLAADELPIIYEHIYIPVERVPDLQVQNLENNSFTNLLYDRYKIRKSANGRSTIEVRVASQSIAEQLRLNIGDPVMIMKTYMNDYEEHPLYISHEIIAGSRYRISI